MFPIKGVYSNELQSIKLNDKIIMVLKIKIIYYLYYLFQKFIKK